MHLQVNYYSAARYIIIILCGEINDYLFSYFSVQILWGVQHGQAGRTELLPQIAGAKKRTGGTPKTW
jgi:hypothetical protein